MPKYEIKEVSADGVYVVVTRDDGSTFGQVVKQIDLANEAEALRSINSFVSSRLSALSNHRIPVEDLRKYVGIEYTVGASQAVPAALDEPKINEA